MQPTASKKVNSDKIRKAKYTEGQPIKIKKITSIDSSEVQVSESNSSEKNAENPFSLSEELDDNSSQREMEDKLDNEQNGGDSTKEGSSNSAQPPPNTCHWEDNEDNHQLR